jgi:putative ABC transport system permease protein
MILTALLKESASALWANRLRSFLTVLGMVMGVTSVIVIVAAVEGMQYGIESRKKLTRGLIPIVEQGCPDCDQVGAEGYARDNLKYETHRMRRVEIRGETPNMMEIRNFDIVTGRYMSWEDDERRKQVAFIGYEVYEKFFEGIDPLGRKIRIGGREFTVIGVAEKIDQALIDGMDNFGSAGGSSL